MMTFLLFGIIGWLVLISFFIFRVWSHYNSLVERTDKRRLNQVLDNFIKDSEDLKMGLQVVKKRLEEMDSEKVNYFQRASIFRFNPFKGISGDQSFVLSLLNENKTGLVLNFIYTKDGLRVYAKKVSKGQGADYKLSDEEKKVVEGIS